MDSASPDHTKPLKHRVLTNLRWVRGIKSPFPASAQEQFTIQFHLHDHSQTPFAIDSAKNLHSDIPCDQRQPILSITAYSPSRNTPSAILLQSASYEARQPVVSASPLIRTIHIIPNRLSRHPSRSLVERRDKVIAIFFHSIAPARLSYRTTRVRKSYTQWGDRSPK